MEYVFLMVEVSTQFMPLNFHYHHNAKQCTAIWRVYIAYARHGTQFDYHKILVILPYSDPSCWAIPLFITANCNHPRPDMDKCILEADDQSFPHLAFNPNHVMNLWKSQGDNAVWYEFLGWGSSFT